MLDGHRSENIYSAVLSMNFNASSPKMKKSSAGRGGSNRPRNKQAQNPGSFQGQASDGLYQNSRLVNAVTSLLGYNVLVTAKSGKQFEGVLKTVSPEGAIVLGKACQVEEQRPNGVVGSSLQLNDLFEQFVIHRKNWVKVEFKDVVLEESHKDAFKTDNAITKKVNGQPLPKKEVKELEKWVPSEGADGALETPPLHSTMANGWSAEQMFNVNEKKYGVKSTYNEANMELVYTTKLEKVDTPEYREKEKFAAQKAEEIIKESPFERGTPDSGRSEEQLYSSVVRKYERSTPQNWRNPHQDKSEREQRSQKVPPLGSSSPSTVKQEPLKSVQAVEEVPRIQIKEKVIKPVTETAVESKTEVKVEASSDAVKDPKPPQTVSPTKLQVSTIKTPVNHTSPKVSHESPKDPPVVPKTKEEVVEELKTFGTNFKLTDKKSKESGPKVKKSGEEEEKISNEKKKEEKEKESEPSPQETKTEDESTSVEENVKSSLNPYAQEFRPGPMKRGSPSPRSSSTPSSGAPSPFQPQPHYSPSPYPPSGIYSRNGPRGGRGLRPEFIEHPNYVNASNAVGQPFFTQPIPQFVNQGSPSGMPFIQPGRHPALHGPLFIQHGQHMMMQMNQMAPGPYADGTLYYGHGHPMQMIQSPQMTPPSMQQPQFSFSPPSLPHQAVNAVRPVSQAVMSQPPQQPNILLVRQPNEISPAQIINRSTQAPSYAGN